MSDLTDDPVQRIARAAWVFAHRVDEDWPAVEAQPALRNMLTHVQGMLRYLLAGDPPRAGEQLERVDENFLQVPGDEVP